jgi:hypothetical protein
MMRLVVGDEVGEVGYMCSLPLLQAMASRMVVSVIMWTAWGRRP